MSRSLARLDSLSYRQLQILSVLHANLVGLTLTEIGASLAQPYDFASAAAFSSLRGLRARGFVTRQAGPRGHYRITAQGKRALSTVLKVLTDHSS